MTHETLDAAVHAQPPGVLMATETDPPVDATDAEAGVSAYTHGAAA
jgi:hypothetical protein